MDETLRQLGGILLRAVPTFLLVLLLHLYLKFIFFKPLQQVLRQRYEATEGARRLAEASLAKASEKAAEYEAAIRQARAETSIAQAKAALTQEVEGLKKNLAAESDTLADRIAGKILSGRAA